MSALEDRVARLLEAEDGLKGLRTEVDRLKSGGGGGTSGGGMEERVGRLERNVDQLVKDMTDVKVDLATLKERVAHLPSKGFIVTANITAIGLLTAAIVFADKLRALVG